MAPRYVAVAGPAEADPPVLQLAFDVGAGLAERGAVVLTGGLGGVMAEAARGARGRGGLVVGLLPGTDRSSGNPHLSVALATGLGQLRNGLLVNACDALVAVGASWGTLSEVSLAVRAGKPVVWLGGPGPVSGLSPQPPAAADAAAAVDLLLAP